MSIFTTQDASRIALAVYGLRASAHALPGECDYNFHLQTEAGQAFVLKIAPPAEQRSTLDLQNKALEHLAARDPASCFLACVSHPRAKASQPSQPQMVQHISCACLPTYQGNPSRKAGPIRLNCSRI